MVLVDGLTGINKVQNVLILTKFSILRCDVLKETGIMVRDPAVQIMNAIKNIDPEKPAVRFVLYGRNGVGKSITLSHMTHFGHNEGFITMTFSQVTEIVLILSRYIFLSDKEMADKVL